LIWLNYLSSGKIDTGVHQLMLSDQYAKIVKLVGYGAAAATVCVGRVKIFEGILI